MLAHLDFRRLETALANPLHWLELALVLLCLGLAWAIDRRLYRDARERTTTRKHPRLSGSVGRIVFSLLGLLFLAIARPAFLLTGAKPFFIDFAIPLLVALAVIRMLVYVMRQLFASSNWLTTSERAISFSIWVLVILYFLGVLPEIARELDEITVPIGKTWISLLTIFKGAAVVLLTLVVSLWISSLIEQRLSQAQIDNNLRAVLGRVVRAVILVVGVLIALQSIGFDLTLLTVFGGALGVGVGLGLQKLAANYIAGFTILLDRAIELGDMITVDGRQGRVANVTSRYVLLRGLDGVEIIVPNETVVTTTVLNHSPTSHNVRVASTVRIAHDADVEHALRLMEEAARGEPRALSGKEAPTAFLNAVSDIGIELEVLVWISGGNAGAQGVRSDLQRRILAAFGREGIALAPARRDIRLVDGQSPATANPASTNAVGAEPAAPRPIPGQQR